MSFALYRLKDSRPAWARLTALIARGVSEQKESGGKRTRALYVNAEYVNTPHQHSAPKPLTSLTVRGWSCFSVSMLGLRTACGQTEFVSSLSRFFSVWLHLRQHILALLSSWHQRLPSVFVCAAHFSAFYSFYLGHVCSTSRWQAGMAAPSQTWLPLIYPSPV